jgi:O-antigen/teichoic acid export membrane protein
MVAFAHPVTAHAGDVDLHTLEGLVTRGIVALVSRSVAMQFLVLGGTVALMRLLSPRDFGVFAIAQSVLGMIVFFGDTGVGGALVRQPETPSARQLSSVFYLQLGMSAALTAAVMAAARFVPRIWPDLPADAPLLFGILALDFVVVSLRIAPMLLLERRFQFGRIAVIELVGWAAFYGTAVSLASAGFGVWALAAGVLAKGVLTTVAVFRVAAWRPAALFAWDDLRPLMRFGIAQQSRNVIGLVNDAVVPFWGGRVLGVTAVGYLNWARTTAYFPLRMVDTLRSVGFPLFARLQHDRALLGESVGRAIQLSALVTFGSVGLCIGLGEPLTRYVFSEQWLPAVPLLTVFAVAISIGFLSPLVASALDALGQPAVFARVAAGWTIVNWVAVPIATAYGGTRGFAIGYASHVIIGNIVIARVLRRELPASKLWLRMRAPVAAGCAMATLGRLALAPRVHGPMSFALAAVAAILLYVGVCWVLDGPAIVRALSIVPHDGLAAANATPADRGAALASLTT